MSGAFQLNFVGFPSNVDENELRGVDAADARSTLLVGSAVYGTHVNEPRRIALLAEESDHITD